MTTISESQIAAEVFHFPKHEEVVRGLLDSDLTGKNLDDYHTLIIERRYDDAGEGDEGYAFILLGDYTENGDTRMITIGWGEKSFMMEALWQLAHRVDISDSNEDMLRFSSMDGALQDHIRHYVAPIEWHRADEDWLSERLMAAGLNGKRPHVPFVPESIRDLV